MNEISTDGERILSPLDDDSSAGSEHISLSPGGPVTTDYTHNMNLTDNDVEGKNKKNRKKNGKVTKICN